MNISALAASAGSILFPALVLYAGFMDLMTLKIRNILVVAILVAWLVLAPLAGFSWNELGMSLAVAGVVFALTFTFFALGWIGGGDAKLATVTALWIGPDHALLYFAYASFLGGLLTLLILKLRSPMVPAMLYKVPFLAQLQDKKAGVPYGAAMAPAALIVFPATEWILKAAF
jgi:prepilin peptidase CpaA